MDKQVAQGVITRGVGGNYTVDCNGLAVPCKAGGRLRIGEYAPLVGDDVTIETDDNGEGYIVAIAPRRNSFVRPAVANIDRLFIVASQAPPVTDTYLIDKVTVIAAWQEVEPVILLGKSDLNSSCALRDTYLAAGLRVISVSAETGQGVDELRRLLTSCVSAFTGNSGVGKSSLLNKLDSRFSLSVGDISQRIARGKNTTRHVELLRVGGGGYVADTPGFSVFDITKVSRIPKDKLAWCFPEMRPYLGKCRFSDCAHLEEPDCAVIGHIKKNPALATRHDSYKKLYAELAKLNEWELKPQ